MDHSQRSALKKIIERDDTPAKTIVLCVCGIAKADQSLVRTKEATNTTDTKPESPAAVVWLTDGWYPIQALLDLPLSTMLRKGRLRVGVKLLIHGAELIGSQDACPPLEAPESLMLKVWWYFSFRINIKSVRMRARKARKTQTVSFFVCDLRTSCHTENYNLRVLWKDSRKLSLWSPSLRFRYYYRIFFFFFPPLLKISANSTRRARWDTKLGFYKDPRPFPLLLSALYANGGVASRVDITVLRSYPIQVCFIWSHFTICLLVLQYCPW